MPLFAAPLFDISAFPTYSLTRHTSPVAIPHLPPPFLSLSVVSTARSMCLTHSAKRQSQQTRQRLATHTEKDFYDCPLCGRLFKRRRGTHKRHIRSCIAKHEARVREDARTRAERVEIPTPDPYTAILTSTEIDDGSTGTGA